MGIRESEPAARPVTCRRLAIRVVKVVGFGAFTAYVVDVAVTATGPAVDITFDIAVYVTLVVHIVRRWLARRTATYRAPLARVASQHGSICMCRLNPTRARSGALLQR